MSVTLQNPETVPAGVAALKLLRRLLLVLVALVLLVGFTILGAYLYVASGSANPRIAAQLRVALGMPVQVGSANMGLSRFSLGAVTVYPPNADPTAPPWVSVGALSADLSCWQVLAGQGSPSQIALTDVKVDLAFDREGRLLTAIPTPSTEAGQALPECQCDSTTVTLRREGCPPLVFTGVQSRLAAENGQTILTLHSPAVHVDRAALEGLPFVPAQTWRHVVVTEGETTIEMTLRFPRADAPDARIGYRIVLEPRDATIDITGIKLHTTKTSGTVIVEDGQVQLRGVCGQTADGTMRTDADMDFRGDVYHLNFGKIDVQGIDLQKLPQTWKLPMFVTGRLDGNAHLLVQVGEAGKLSTTGGGEGVIVGAARLLGFGLPLSPIRLTMTASDKGFQFQPLGKPQSRQADQAAAVALATLLVAPEVSPPPNSETSSGGRGSRRAEGGDSTEISGKIGVVVRRSAARQEPRPPEIPAAGFPRKGGIAQAAAFLPPPPLHSGDGVGGWSVWLVDQLGEGVLDAGGAASRAAGRVVRAVQPYSVKEPATTYLDADLGLRDVDLAQLLDGLKLQLPVPVTGRGSFQVHVGIPLGNSGDPKAYRLTGTAHLSWVKIADLKLTAVDAQVAYRDGLLNLEKLSGKVPGGRPPEPSIEPAGTFRGAGRVQVSPPGDLSVQLDLERLPVRKLLKTFPALADVGGQLGGHIQARAPLLRLTDPTAWDVTGQFQSDRLTASGWTLSAATADLRAVQGDLSLSRLAGQLQGAPVVGQGNLKLTPPYAFSAKLALAPGGPDEVQKLPVSLPAGIALAGRFAIDADLSGTLSPLTVQASGAGRADVLDVGGLRFDGLQVKWDANAERILLTDLRVKYDQGELTGTGRIPLQAAGAGDLRLKFDGLDVAALSKEVKAIPFRLDGTASGSLETTIPAAGERGVRNVTSHLEMTAPRLRVQGLPTQKLKGDLDYRDGQIEYKLEGSVLGGKFDLNGKVPLPERPELVPIGFHEAELVEPQGPGPAGAGRLRLEGLRLSLLGEALQWENPPPLSGRLDLDVRFAPGPDGLSVGDGSVRLRSVRYDSALLTDDLQADVVVHGSQVRLSNFVGVVAEGTIVAQLVYDWVRPSRSWFSIGAQRMEAARLLAPFPELAARLTGLVELRIRGTIGREVDASGEVLLARGAVSGVEVIDWRLPVHFAFNPFSGRGQFEVRDSAAHVGSGRVTGQVTGSWGAVSRLDGQVRFINADLNALLRPAGTLNGYAAGRATGRFDFAGNSVQSIDDLTGLLDASFQQTQAQALPILPQLLPFLLPGGSASTTFQSGDVRARLAGGVWRIERVRLVGPLLQMFIEGRATMQGRLDLDVTANANLLNLTSPVLRTFGLRLPTTPLPGRLLTEARNLLTARLAYLHVSGTVASPNIRFEPVRLLPEEAVRFFFGVVGR